MERTSFRATTRSGGVVGWVAGQGPPVLALPGGSALNFDYLDEVVGEIAARHRVATIQQRGLAPSTLEVPGAVLSAVDRLTQHAGAR